MCTQFDVQLVILDDEADGAPEDELGKDLMAIVQVYCCRWNGKRRYKNQKGKIDRVGHQDDETAAHPDEAAETHPG